MNVTSQLVHPFCAQDARYDRALPRNSSFARRVGACEERWMSLPLSGSQRGLHLGQSVQREHVPFAYRHGLREVFLRLVPEVLRVVAAADQLPRLRLQRAHRGLLRAPRRQLQAFRGVTRLHGDVSAAFARKRRRQQHRTRRRRLANRPNAAEHAVNPNGLRGVELGAVALDLHGLAVLLHGDGEAFERRPLPKRVIGDVIQRLRVVRIHAVQLLDRLQRGDHALLRREVRGGALERGLHREGFFVGGIQLESAVQRQEGLLVVVLLVEAVGNAHADRGGGVGMVWMGETEKRYREGPFGRR